LIDAGIRVNQISAVHPNEEPGSRKISIHVQTLQIMKGPGRLEQHISHFFFNLSTGTTRQSVLEFLHENLLIPKPSFPVKTRPERNHSRREWCFGSRGDWNSTSVDFVFHASSDPSRGRLFANDTTWGAGREVSRPLRSPRVTPRTSFGLYGYPESQLLPLDVVSPLKRLPIQ